VDRACPARMRPPHITRQRQRLVFQRRDAPPVGRRLQLV
jgi:hypothetical protein